MKIGIIIIALLMYGRSCTTNRETSPYYSYKVLGYKPVYSLDTNLKKVVIDTPHIVKNAGKIYVYQKYILQCEVGEGIHIIDNSVPSAAKRIHFIKVLGANEISIKDNFLYTNSFKDLVVINVSNILQPKEVKRIPNAFLVKGYLPVPPVKTLYECVDVSKGVVVGWVKDSINPTCIN
jgi:hypothetical protein